MNQFPPDFGWWVTGMVDGEGCFYARMCFRTKKNFPDGQFHDCVEFDARLQIALRADDLEVLEKIRSYFGCGDVRYKKSSQNAPSHKKSGIVGHPQYHLVISRPDDLMDRVIPHFEMYPLQSKKARDFEIWKKTVEFYKAELIGKKGWMRRFPEKVEQIQEMCDQLKTVRRFEPALAIEGGK